MQRWFSIALAAAVIGAANASPVIKGKDGWLYFSYETPRPDLWGDVQRSVQLVAKLSQLLARNNVQLAVVVVPAKIDVHSEQLPADLNSAPFMHGYHARVQASLEAAGVAVIDIREAMRRGAGVEPMFARTDTHWSPKGAITAAHAVAAALAARPALKAAVDSVPRAEYAEVWEKNPVIDGERRDLVRLLGADEKEYPIEPLPRFSARRINRSTDLFGTIAGGHMAIVGSSFSGEWSGFADALRHALQRDVLNYAVNADVGQWNVMRSYLRNDAFQAKPPALVIWEFPERTVAWPPSYKFREPRYQMDDMEWLLDVAALTQPRCEPAGVAARLDTSGLRSGKARGTTESDYVEIAFDKPVDRRSYLSARAVTHGSRLARIEAHARGSVRAFTVEVANDEEEHPLKTPLSTTQTGVQKIRLLPGDTHEFRLTDLKVCRYPADVLR